VSEGYSLTADSFDQPGAAKGRLEPGTLAPGRHFPGAPHDFAVYLPAADTIEPLPWMIFLDGGLFRGDGIRATAVLDNLIAAGDIPPLVAIFVDPGVVAARSANQQARFERSYEYDSLSSRFGDFLFDELLPEVAKLHPLSDNPDQHAIAGLSTGAVGAFMAAWHRPDRIRRVLSTIGTFVAMRGADTVPALVRKTDAKPLRVWVQAGERDHVSDDQPHGSHYAGSWPVASRTLFEALQFSGYHAHLSVGNGGHDFYQLAAELPDALRWLWSGPTTNAGAAAAVQSSADWAEVESAQWASLAPSQETAELQLPFEASARLWDGAGRLYVLEAPVIGRSPRLAIVLLDGSVEAEIVELSIPGASSLAISPDGALLIVTDALSRFQWSFPLREDGIPVDGEPYFRLETLDDSGASTGAAVDSAGWVYFATALGVQVAEPIGRVARILNSPIPGEPVTDVAFGGADSRSLFVVSAGRVFERPMTVPGVARDERVRPPDPAL
jgi:gluconolactonase